MFHAIRKLGNNVIYVITDLGRMGVFLLKVVRGCFEPPFVCVRSYARFGL